MKFGVWCVSAIPAVTIADLAVSQQAADIGFESVGRAAPVLSDINDYEITGPTHDRPVARKGYAAIRRSSLARHGMVARRRNFSSDFKAKVARLEKELATAHTIIDVQGKLPGYWA